MEKKQHKFFHLFFDSFRQFCRGQKKNTIPAADAAKTVLPLRLQGLEPWTP
jgi:hypothetical protein